MILNGQAFTGFEHFQAKFIRVGNEIHITDRDDLKTLHIRLAEKDKIFERVEKLKNQDATNVDGGIIYISGRVVRVASASTSLGIPLLSKARKLTIEILKQAYPGFSIKELADE